MKYQQNIILGAASCVVNNLGSTTINTASNLYQIQFRPSTSPTSAKTSLQYLKIYFPSATNIIPGTMTCAIASGGANSFSGVPSCTAGTSGSDNFIWVSNVVSGQSLYPFTVTLTNPGYAVRATGILCFSCTSSMTSSTCTSSNNLESASVGTILQFTPNTVTSCSACSISSSSNINGVATATMTFKFITQNAIVQSGALRFYLTQSNYNFQSAGATSPAGFSSNSNGIPNTITIAYGSVGSANTYVTVGTPVFIGDPTGTDRIDTLIIPFVSTASIAAGQQVVVTMFPCTNPPSTQSVGSFEFHSGYYIAANSVFYSTDQFQGISLQTTTPAQFSQGSLIPQNAQTMVSQTGVTYWFQFITTNDIPQYGLVKIFAPSTMTLDCTNTKWSLTVGSQGSTGCETGTGGVTCSSVDNSLTLNGCFTTAANFLYAGSQFDVYIYGFTNPSASITIYFTIMTYSVGASNSYPIDTSSTYFSFTPSLGVITIYSVKPGNNEIYDSSGVYTFVLKCEHAITSSYQLYITLPNSFSVVQTTSCTVTGLGTSYSCAGSSANLQIVIGTLQSYTIAAGTTLTFTVNSIMNPGIYTAPGTLSFNLVSGSYSVDSGSYIFPSGLFVMSNIQTFTVSADSYQCGDTNVNYQFTVIPKFRVSKGAYLTLSLPSDISITDTSLLTTLCPTNVVTGFSNSYVQCNYDSTTKLIYIKYGFYSSASPGNPPTLIFKIPSITNPRTLKPSGTFNVTIYDQNNAILYRFNTTAGPTITMTQTNNPLSMNYVRTSYTNGVTNDYTININAYSSIYSNDLFTFTLPQTVRFTKQSQVIGNCYWLNGVQTSQFSGDLQSVTMTVNVNPSSRRQLELEEYFLQKSRNLQTASYIIPGSFLSINLTSITSSPSLRPDSSSITFQMKSSSGYLFESLNSGLTIQNTVSGILNSTYASVQPNYFEKSALANYTLAFAPLNFERNMQIWIIIPNGLYIPDGYQCQGIKGTDDVKLTCNLDRSTNTLVLTDAVTEQALSPGFIIFQVISIQNPEKNIVTDSFIFQTYTYDGYLIDELSASLSINFYCIYPCKECNISKPDQCYSCYANTTSQYFLLFKSECLSDCIDGQYKQLNIKVPTCDYCKSPCQTCNNTNQTCLTCIQGYALYEVDNTCYEIITWYFPFLGATALVFIIVIITDAVQRTTNFLHSVLFFLSFIELAAIAYLLLLFFQGKVLGNRQISVISFGSFALLNIIFIPVHQKLVINKATPEYKQILQQYRFSSYIILILSYILNFKIQVFLVSKFGALPRFSGTYDGDNWRKFNMFAILYIILVYLPFLADFYLYFTQYGLRQITSFVAIEAAGIMTIITLILLLELLNQCACVGLNEQDLGKRAGLINDMKNQGKKNKKRKADREGMGNDDSYGLEYGSEYDFHDDGQKIDEQDSDEYYDDEEEEEDEEDEIDSGTKKKKKTPGMNQKQLDMIEQLAQQMKDQKSKIEEEKQRVLNEKLKLLKEKEKYFKDASQLKDEFDKDRDKLMSELTNLDNKKDELKETVDRRIDEKLAANKPALVLPQPIFDFICLEKGIDGDDEYWLQNATPRQGNVSDRSQLKEKDGSVIDYLSKTEGRASFIQDGRATVEDQQEMRANISHPMIGEINSVGRSLDATEMEFINKSQGIFGASDRGMNKNATEEMLIGEKNFEGTEIDHYDKKSAVFGDISDLQIDATQRDFIDKSDAAYEAISKHKSAIEPMMDQGGRSSESSEGIVADHAPFKGIKEAMENQEKLRRQQIDTDESAEEEQRPQDRRRIKQVLYSDKSESSVDDMMEDTPSNYNIANGRLEGKSMGLKAILLFAKNQGINIAAQGRNNGNLPQIQEEEYKGTPQDAQFRAGMNSSGDAGHWKPMNNPLNGLRGTQIVGTEDFGRQIGGTIDYENQGSKPSKNKVRSNRNPGLQKQFKEPGDQEDDDSELARIKKNNFL